MSQLRIVLLMLLLPSICLAQLKPSYYFENINQESGLSQGTGYAIAEYMGYILGLISYGKRIEF